MKSGIPKTLALLLIIALSLPLYVIPAHAAPSSAAHFSGITQVETASDVAARKIHSKLAAELAEAAPQDQIDILVYAKAGTDLSRYLVWQLVRPFVYPNGLQA
ncbi:MAG: hypothetical protein J7M34_07695, partial [Anaerolineae bacterium]|nr:hypothetical protein [Anaerolineae bacterium]